MATGPWLPGPDISGPLLLCPLLPVPAQSSKYQLAAGMPGLPAQGQVASPPWPPQPGPLRRPLHSATVTVTPPPQPGKAFARCCPGKACARSPQQALDPPSTPSRQEALVSAALGETWAWACCALMVPEV